ncbi:MAG: hypothetical protein RL662_1867 [Bacteroidota bacterium]|jgi:hypothetical protein
MEIGKKVLANELVDCFIASEGSINMYYGLIGNGKSYSATSDILDLLKQGKVVYANWHIEVEDFDDRENLFMLIMNTILFKKRFYKIPCAKNLHYFDPEDFNSNGQLVEWLSSLNDCHIFFDEGQDMFDSYEGTKFSKAKRRLILHTRHYHRTLNIMSQRPTAIQVSARGNVNRFYKCVKLAQWPWVRFARYEFQQMKGETVDEEAEPISVKRYFGNNKVFKAYNTNFLAEGIPKSQQVHFEAYDLTTGDKLSTILKKMRKVIHRLSTGYPQWLKLTKREKKHKITIIAEKGDRRSLRDQLDQPF